MRYHKFILLLLSSSFLAGCSAQEEQEEEEGECLNNDTVNPSSPPENNGDKRNDDDKNNNTNSCESLALRGDCTTNQEYMFKHCPYDCKDHQDLGVYGYLPGVDVHVDGDCEDHDEYCEQYAWGNECLLNPDHMVKECPKSCRVCFASNTYKIGTRQILEEEDNDEESEEEVEGKDPEEVQDFLKIIYETNKYMSEVVMKEKEYESIRIHCRNFNELCTQWAMEGYCEQPDNYDDLDDDDDLLLDYHAMIADCSPACQTCHELKLTEEEVEVVNNCINDPETSAIQSGDDLNNIFLRIVGELPFKEGIIVPDYDVTILSRPSDPSKSENAENKVDKNDDDKPNHPFIGGPWVVTLDNFISDDECDRLIELGGMRGYKTSTMEDPDEDPSTRTSTNTWCSGECYDDPISQRVMSKIANTTGIPFENSEDLQLLRYDPGQFYDEHHDNDASYFDRLYKTGPRLLTFFLYLNDVEEGGGTMFTDLSGNFEDESKIEMVVQPKKGRALVWPSVLSEDLHQTEDRTWHAALAVTKGVKFGANSWIHPQNYKNDDCDYDFVDSLSVLRR